MIDEIPESERKVLECFDTLEINDSLLKLKIDIL